MAKQLPEKWNSLNVANDLGLRGDYPRNLAVYKVKNTNKLGCRYLPAEEEDTRPNKGRNSSGKRKYIFGRTGFDDPFQAGKQAISWCKEQRKKLQFAGEVEKYNSKHSLHHYWEIYWARINDDLKNSDRKKRDTLNRWNGKGWGLGEQSWSYKSIDDIDASDMEDYFKLMDERGDGSVGSMSKQKEGQKSLLNHLVKEARKNDFKQLPTFIFPTISKDDKEVEHFSPQEWEKLVHKVNDLSGGKARKIISKTDYEKLDWTDRDIFNQRNWVDLYDCLMLNWFFYLRPLDIPRLKSEWFSEIEDGRVRLFMERTKGDRRKQETTHYRPDAHKFWKRMDRRRPKGYLAFSFYERKEGAENQSNVGQTLNRMLQKVVDLCHIKKRNRVVWGIIRHTAFRLTLEDFPELGLAGTNIESFASNGMTSSKMLHKTYLKSIDNERVAKEALKKIKPSSYSLIRKIGDKK